eukprot:1159684-Pelagomonas_calceolata.AAC.7
MEATRRGCVVWLCLEFHRKQAGLPQNSHEIHTADTNIRGIHNTQKPMSLESRAKGPKKMYGMRTTLQTQTYVGRTTHKSPCHKSHAQKVQVHMWGEVNTADTNICGMHNAEAHMSGEPCAEGPSRTDLKLQGVCGSRRKGCSSSGARTSVCGLPADHPLQACAHLWEDG